MKLILISTAISLISLKSFGQIKLKAVELSSQFQTNTYKEFYGYYLGSSIGNVYLKLKSKTSGFKLGCLYSISKTLNFMVGVGFNKINFLNIRQRNNIGITSGRVTNYVSATNTYKFTNDYSYNTVSFNLGIEKVFELPKKLNFLIRLNVEDYITFSQKYALSENINLSSKKARNFGVQSQFSLGVMKYFQKISLGPIIQLPIYGYFNGDNLFPNETDKTKRGYGFNGFGVALSVNYLIKTNE